MPTPQVFMSALATPKSQVNWTTIAVASTDYFTARVSSSGVQNDEISWDFAVDAGTYTFELFHRRGTTAGIYTVQIDGVAVGTVDGFNGSGITTRSTITGLVLTTGVHTLRLLMATKNASATNHFGFVAACGFLKTA